MRIELNSGKDIIAYELRGGGTVEIVEICVGSERGKGVGTQLINQMLLAIGPNRFVYAMTRESNLEAIKFYKLLGFNEIATIHSLYQCDPNKQEGHSINAIVVGRKS